MEPVQALLLVLVAVASLCPAFAVEVQVLPDLASDCSSSSDNNGGAVNIDTALMNTRSRSNTTLLLENGCYLINSFTLLQDLSNISLIGSGSETTIVKCQEVGLGLAFVNISGLRLTDMTISSCNLSGINLQNTFLVLRQSLNVIYIFPPIVGIFIGDTSNLQAHNMIVRNTPGTGMAAINLMGTSDMSNVTFINNRGFSYGGGLYIQYVDYHSNIPTVIPKLAISASLFKWNFNTIGSGGGLSITLSQIKFPVDINVASTTFENNTSLQGGGAAIFYFQGVSGSSVNISNSTFQKNVVRGGGLGGGLAMILNLPQNNQLLQDVLPVSPNTIIVENTTIEENQATSFAGASIFSSNSQLCTKSNQNYVIFKSCMFLRNKSPTGAAFGAESRAFSGSDPEISITFDNVIVKENDVSSFTAQESLQAGATEGRSVAVLSSVNLIIKGKSQFLENFGSALLLVRSTVTIVDGDVSFAANEGSGIGLLDFSRIVLQNNSKLAFIKNRAISRGGAIFVDLRSSVIDSSLISDCFLMFEDLNLHCTNFENCFNYVSQLNVSLVFEDNQAPVGGTIYGSRLSTCPWAVYDKPSLGIAFLQQLPSVTFKPSLFNFSVVSTDAFYLYSIGSL